MRTAIFMVVGFVLSAFCLMVDYFLDYTTNVSLGAWVGGILLGMAFRDWWGIRTKL